MRLWRPTLAEEMRAREATLREAEREAVRAVARPARRSSFDCQFCGGHFVSYPALLNHRCDEVRRA